MKRRTFLGGLLAGVTVGIAGPYLSQRKRRREVKEAFKDEFDLSEPGWHHVVIFIDRGGPAKAYLNGEPYTTKLDKLRYKIRRLMKRGNDLFA